MLSEHVRSRFLLVVVLLAVILTASACYKNAGENVQPTSNRVDLSDIQPTNTPEPTRAPVTPTATAAIVATPTDGSAGEEDGPAPTATITLAPTITPADEPTEEGDVAAPTVEIEETAAVEPTAEPAEASAETDATATPRIAPSFTPMPTVPPGDAIATPGMSELRPSATPAPTLDPALQPTPTDIPPEENPCLHVVQPGDTLYSIAREYEVELDALVAANPSLLGGSALTVLQLGWQLQLPGCATETPTPVPQPTAETTGDINVAPGQDPGVEAPPSTGTTHVVQAGDTVFSIARQYGVTPDAIIAANNLRVSGNVVYISVGQTLTIPPAQ